MLGLSDNRKALENINCGQGNSQFLQALDVLTYFLPNPHENLVFQIGGLFTRLQHLSLNPCQFLCPETLRIFQCRLAEEMARYMSQLGISHMEVVTVFFIIINL